MTKYRIIETNPDTGSEMFEVQSSFDNGETWGRIFERTSLKEAEFLYDDLIKEHSKHYGYKVIRTSE